LKEYSYTSTLQDLFEEQVSLIPDNLAILSQDESLTYRALNTLANQLAHYLLEMGVGAGTLIAIALDRSPKMLVSLLGILKAGATYVPLDTNQPIEQTQFILEDTEAPIIIADSSTIDNIPVTFAHLVSLDEEWSEIVKYPSTNPCSRTSDLLAYIIYTSGTTGKPKGVMVEDRSVVNYIVNVRESVGLSPGYKIDFSTNLGFDLSVTTTIAALCIGAQIVVYDSEQQNLEAYSHHLISNEVQVIKLVPSYFDLLIDILPATKINKIILGGEKLSSNIIDKINLLPNKNEIELFDEYGPTEATVGACIYKVQLTKPLTIGKPYNNYNVYILDNELNSLPYGITGELYIGGLGVARGYLNQPELTAERFINNPFQTEKEKLLNNNAKLYKTGDLARWLEDGNLEYIGRNDHQVKIDGHRVELEHIETILSSYPGITQCVAIATERKNDEGKPTENKYLIAYYRSKDKIDDNDILTFLKQSLPLYMLPKRFLHLENFPLTLNGKIDRRALLQFNSNSNDRLEPRNRLEKKLCQLWARIFELEENEISINDDFLRLGGSSILAIKFVSELNKEFGSHINVSDIFENNTIEKLAIYLENHSESTVIIQKETLKKEEKQSLSFAQERLWFIEKYEQGTNAYNVPMVLKLSNEVKWPILERSIRSIITRHEILRTLIKEDETGHGYQVVIDDHDRPLEIKQVMVDNETQLCDDLQKEINCIYDLNKDYPIRVFLHQVKNDKTYFLSVIIHHIAFDGWSIDLFLKELQEFYRYYLDESLGKTSCLNLPELTIQYKDFALWQRRYLVGERLEKQLGYWKKMLSGYEPLQLMTDKPRPARVDYQGKDIYFELDEETSTSLRELAKTLKVSLYTVLLSGYYLLLRSYSQQDDIIIGTPIANRHYHQIEHLMGFFVNSLALRTKIDAKMLLLDFILQVGSEVMAAQFHQDLPFERLVEELKVEKDTSRHPLFQIMFGVQNFWGELNVKKDTETNLPKLLQPYIPGIRLHNAARVDISTFFDDSQINLRGSFNYAVSLYTEETISNLIDTYVHILQQIAKLLYDQERSTKISDLTYLTKQQYHTIINEWNQTTKTIEYKFFTQFINEQVEKIPNNIAIQNDHEALTYEALHIKTNQLAHYLIQSHVKAGCIIAVCLKHPMDMIIGMIAAIKSTGIYLPIDHCYPEERINFILEDSEAHFLITEKSLHSRFKNYNGRIIFLDEDWSKIKNESKFVPNLKNTLNDLAYIIYTSGSTGQPKGVMIEHISLINFLNALEALDSLDVGDHLLQNVSFCFDPSILITLWSLMKGATLITATSEQIKDPDFSIDCIQKYSIRVFHAGPSLFRLLFAHPNIKNCISLKHIFGGGEAWNKNDLHLIKNYLPGCCLTNVYGPTEATIYVTTWTYRGQELAANSIPIGQMIPNSRIYVLDQYQQQVPFGAIGELYIGGLSLARGYLNRASLTAEKFFINPFQTREEKINKQNSRIYKTGDMVKWLPDGNLEYIQRNDFQVKIRGHRIELEEIQTVLSTYIGIKQCVVLADETRNCERELSGDKILVGYYISEYECHEVDIINFLQNRLPEYMIPNVLIRVDKMPLTFNGKLDINALPRPSLSSTANYLAPRNKLENRLCQIWAETLGQVENDLGIQDDFFKLGGSSLLTIRLVSRINKELLTNITVACIFKFSTIEKLAFYLTHHAEETITIQKTTIKKEEEQSLSFAQERLWFIEKFEQGTNAYHIPMVFKLANELKWPILERSIRNIVSRHEILSTLIKEDEAGHAYQVVIDNHDHPLEIKHITLNNETQLCDNLQKEINCIYDLDKDYPIRVFLYQVTDEKIYYLSVIIHHIAFDGWSIDLFLKELQQFYHYYLNESLGKTGYLNLPELSIQYKDFALWQRSYLVGERLEKQLAYWREVLSGYEPLQLMTDKPRPARVDYQGQDINFELDESTSISLRQLAKALNVSLYTVLLSGYYLLLRSYSQQDDIVLGTPVANRHYHQIEHLIGFFVNSLALRTKIDAKMLLRDFILQVGSDVKSAQLHQDLPFERLVEELKIEKDTSRHPLFQIMFGMQNFGGDLDSSLFIPYTPAQNVYQIAKFDISTFLDDRGSCLKGVFNYATCLYDAETIQNLIKTYQLILRQLSQLAEDMQRQASMTISDLTYLSREDYDKIIYQWNQTDRSYPTEKTLQAMFEDQVRKTPNQIAVIFEDKQITYRELNEKANQLAHYLLAQCDIKPDTLIGLCLARSEQLLIAILAVLKSGGAYVPMDPIYPEERIEYLLQDTETACLLTNIIYYDRLKKIIDRRQSHIVCIPLDQDELQAKLILQAKENPLTETTSAHLAYVMYTSGTTGYPKGVMIEHGSIVNRITWMNDQYPLNQKDRILQKTPYTFDVSVWELFWGIWYGACIVFASPDGHKNPNYMIDLLFAKSISVIHFVPSMLDVFLDTLKQQTIPSLRYIFCSGEALTLSQVQKCYNALPHLQLQNLYGPTEAAIDAMYSSCHHQDKKVYIGKPISNVTAYILDNSHTPVPLGAVGELCLGGANLARGYLNKLELTTKKFMTNPFQTKKEKTLKQNTKLYKTGDLVRRMIDGRVEYLGRNDFQVKVRGNRVELKEIENALLSYQGITQSVVIAKPHNNNSIVLLGYYISVDQLDADNILDFLYKRLPEYMVPDRLLQLEKLPLTMNGKLDRKALPDIDYVNVLGYAPPRSELEKEMCGVWSEILSIGQEKIGIYDDFFKLGGNSILIVLLTNKINKKFKVNIGIVSIFQNNTIDKLVRFMEKSSLEPTMNYEQEWIF
jgi:amino acid adenylation domain-containing protein